MRWDITPATQPRTESRASRVEAVFVDPVVAVDVPPGWRRQRECWLAVVRGSSKALIESLDIQSETRESGSRNVIKDEMNRQGMS